MGTPSYILAWDLKQNRLVEIHGLRSEKAIEVEDFMAQYFRDMMKIGRGELTRKEFEKKYPKNLDKTDKIV